MGKCCGCKQDVSGIGLTDLVFTWQEFILNDGPELIEVPWHKLCYANELSEYGLDIDAAIARAEAAEAALAQCQHERDALANRVEQADAALAAEREALREFAKTALFRTMSDLSESCWCAGWMEGTEYFLWSAVEKNAPATWGMDDLRQRDIDDLRRLRELAHGWWIWDDEKFETFVSLDEMQRIAKAQP